MGHQVLSAQELTACNQITLFQKHTGQDLAHQAPYAEVSLFSEPTFWGEAQQRPLNGRWSAYI